MKRLFFGTAGWSLPRDHAASFPSIGTGLERYASVFGGVEINSTFRRRHRVATFERWRDAVPASFRFSVKVPEAITHDAELAAPRAPLREFFDDVAGLGRKLGPILVQLPPSAQFNARRSRAFFDALRRIYDGPVACEPRHATWFAPPASKVLVENGIARVLADPAQPPGASEPGGDPSLLYVRLHGSPRRYYSSYDDDWLARIATRVSTAPKGCTRWCIFDNTASGAATGDALRFGARLSTMASGTPT